MALFKKPQKPLLLLHKRYALTCIADRKDNASIVNKLINKKLSNDLLFMHHQKQEKVSNK